MYDKKNRRKQRRHEVSQIRPVQLSSATGVLFFVVPVDESESGLGCIYSGEIAPLVGHVYRASAGGKTRKVELRWITPISKNRFRLGLMYSNCNDDQKSPNSRSRPLKPS